MKLQKLQPDSISWNSLMSACQRDSEWQWALESFRKAAALADSASGHRIGSNSIIIEAHFDREVERTSGILLRKSC